MREGAHLMSWTETFFVAVPDVERLFHPENLVILGDNTSEGVRISQREEISSSLSAWGTDEIEEFESSSQVPDVAFVVEASDVILEVCCRKKIPWIFLLTEGIEVLRTGIFGPLPLGFSLITDLMIVSNGALPEFPLESSSRIGCISQNGSVGVSIMAAAASAGIPFRYGITTGIPFDKTTAWIGRWLLKNGEINLLVVCIETLSEGSAFLDMAREAHDRGVPLAVLRGHGDVSDTALTTDDGVWRTIADQFGLILLEDVEDLLDLCLVVERLPRPQPRGAVALLPLSDGMGTLLSRACISAGLTIAVLPKDIERSLHLLAADTPQSLMVSTSRRISNTSSVLEELVYSLDRGDDADILILAIPALPSPLSENVEDSIRRMSCTLKKPVLCWSLSALLKLSTCSQCGVPFFESPRRCARAMAAYLNAFKAPVLPVRQGTSSTQPVLKAFPQNLNEHDATRLIDAYGLSLVRQKFCRSLDEVLEAGTTLGYPVVIKVVSTDIFSKKAARGIALDIRTEEELQNAYGRILERAHRSCPDAVIDGVLVQEMVEEGIECMIGVKRDPVFGPVVAVGLGGALYDVTKDLALRLAPVDFQEALSMVESLKGYRLFSGLRGRESLDFRSLAHEVVKISILASSEPELLLLDIDSAFVTEQGVRIADAYAFRKKRNERL